MTPTGQATAQAPQPTQRDRKFSASPAPGGIIKLEPALAAETISFDSMNFLTFLPPIYAMDIITLQALFMKFLLSPRESAAIRPKLIKEPGHDAAHPIQSTHLSRSNFLPAASAQFIGHERSQTPQETQASLSMFNPKTDADDAKPITTPAGHQSQNLLPFVHETIRIARKTAVNITEDIPPLAGDAPEATPRPKLEMGSVKRNRGGTANIIPKAAIAETIYRAFHGFAYFPRAAPNLADALHSNS
jgi:hypothetical protein